MRPYISIDIETTGIDKRSEILQISGVIDDGGKLEDLETFDFAIKHESIDYCEPYALGMNADLLKKMMDKDFKCYSPRDAITTLISKLCDFNEKYLDEKGKKQQILFAGKNVASFDIPKIKAFIKKHGSGYNNEVFNSLCHYKTLDIGSLYFDVYGDNVTLSKINKLIGRNEVSYNTLDDAWDVIYAVRHKLGG